MLGMKGINNSPEKIFHYLNYVRLLHSRYCRRWPKIFNEAFLLSWLMKLLISQTKNKLLFEFAGLTRTSQYMKTLLDSDLLYGQLLMK